MARGQTPDTICRQQIEPPEEFQLRQAVVSGILETRNGGVRMANMNQARLEELTGIISRTVTAEQVYLFGSYAYGTPNEDSDLDLYVVIPDGSIPPAEAVKGSAAPSARCRICLWTWLPAGQAHSASGSRARPWSGL